ncbi:hypothetical protein C8R43DRAFT_427875 [Mycena crocata]|nr:hypothetical protein C8R43DRAFT_427875 [Mycena crocata]
MPFQIPKTRNHQPQSVLIMPSQIHADCRLPRTRFLDLVFKKAPIVEDVPKTPFEDARKDEEHAPKDEEETAPGAPPWFQKWNREEFQPMVRDVRGIARDVRELHDVSRRRDKRVEPANTRRVADHTDDETTGSASESTRPARLKREYLMINVLSTVFLYNSSHLKSFLPTTCNTSHPFAHSHRHYISQGTTITSVRMSALLSLSTPRADEEISMR